MPVVRIVALKLNIQKAVLVLCMTRQFWDAS